MKRITALVGIMVWMQLGFSQQHFGVKAGFNMAWKKQHYASTVFPNGWKPDIKSLAGYEAGFFYHIPLAQHWILSAEANFTSRGTKTEVALFIDGRPYMQGPKRYSTDKLFYLDMPLLVQYTVRRVKVGAGPSVGILINSRNAYLGSNLSRSYRTFDAGVTMMAGYPLASKWEVDLRYYHGLTDTYPVNVVTAHNRFTNLSLLYTLK